MNTLAGRTYEIRTFGCQMNKHDSERIDGMLSASGLVPSQGSEPADLYVFMTCCVRENADERLRGQVASLKALKTGGRPDTLIAVGGCIGQRDGEQLLKQLAHVDVVFGTHNVSHLPALLAAAAESRTSIVETLTSSPDFTSDLPVKREHPWHAWVPITVGCDNFCTYCIVPYVRGREHSRPIDTIVQEAHAAVAEGVVEITLLGQNVNSYGRDLYGEPRFASVLREVAATGIQRVRFATSHPKDLCQETIEAMASTPQICRYLHLPAQSGSDRILKAMNRGYTQADYLALVERIYAAMPDIAISTDIIVGFPGESEDDFLGTLELVSAARLDQAFTFIYSPREGTPAARMPGHVPREVAQERFDRLVEAVHGGVIDKNLPLVGSIQKVLVEGPSKRDAALITGRTDGNKVVHAPMPPGLTPSALAGRIVDVRIDGAQTWFLTGTIQGRY